MCDRVSQIQDLVSNLANLMCNSIGYLQETAPPSDFAGPSETHLMVQEHMSDTFCESYAKEIVETAKEIEILVETLPVEGNTQEEHERRLLELDDERARAAKELEKLLEQAENLSDVMSTLLLEMSEVQLNARPSV